MGLSIPEKYDLMINELQSVLDSEMNLRNGITILEAGCGSMSRVKFKPDARLVGMDISKKQLNRNSILHEKILGDLQSYNFPSEAYDLIVCWDVLEHLPYPQQAMLNFFKGVKRGGLILLASPNVMTLRGFATKYTPHWFHVWFYRNIYGRKEAGTEDQPPFKTFHRFSIAPSAIVKFARTKDFDVKFSTTYQIQHTERHALFKKIWNFVNAIVNVFTFGTIGTDKASSFIIVLQKKSNNNSSSHTGN